MLARALLLSALAPAVCADVSGAGAPAADHMHPASSAHEHTFSHSFPPIIRVSLLLALGIGGFGADLQLLERWGLSFWASLRAAPLPMHLRNGSEGRVDARSADARLFYYIGGAHCAWALCWWLLYRSCVDAVSSARTPAAQAIEACATALLLVLWCVPGVFRQPQRDLARTLARILTPSLQQTVHFADVLLADVLTSFAKVLGDVWLSLMIVAYTLRGELADDGMLWNRRTSIEMPILTSVPYLVRLRQCIASYNTASRDPLSPPRRRHLYNALKYASAFPVIWLSAWQGHVPVPQTWLFGFSEASVSYVLWFTAVLFNTLFSFYWDVTYDWGLDLLQVANLSALRGNAPKMPEIRRRPQSQSSGADADEHIELPQRTAHARRASVLRAPEKALPLSESTYWAFIVANLLLRFTWSLKLSSHLQYLVEWQRGLVLLEALELVRRSVWILLRVEWEIVSQEQN